ncbi:MAG: hypothetical protein ACTHME_03355 [Candidatus Nitrosocosmicus sp.]
MSSNNNDQNNQQPQQKPDFTEFKENIENKNRLNASRFQPEQRDAQGNLIFPEQDNMGNQNKSRGVIGVGAPQQTQQQTTPQANSSNYDRPKWDRINKPTNQTQPQLTQIQNPTTPEELDQLIKTQQEDEALDNEARDARDVMWRLEQQNEYYYPPKHLENHRFLTGRKRPPQETMTTEQKLQAGEEVISITDDEPTLKVNTNQQIQPQQIKNGVDNLIPKEQEQNG